MLHWYDWVLAALGLALLMVIHESGHYFVARAFGMRVTRFSIGFGPTLVKVIPRDGFLWLTMAGEHVRVRLGKHDPSRHGPTIFQIAAIPFLAYVQIAGMNPLEEIDENDKGSYANASLVGRVSTIFAGPLANYVFASVFFFASFFFGGHEVRTTDVSVVENSRAAAAMMKTGDRLVEIAGTKVNDWDEMAKAISQHPNQSIPIVVERGTERVLLNVTPANEGGKGRIGVASQQKWISIPLGPREAAVLALKAPAEVVENLVVSLGELIAGKAEGLHGPADIVKQTAEAAHRGYTKLLWLLGALSAYLGAFNLIPFPALDGGRLMFLTYEATTRRRANARIEAHIHLIGLAMMLGLMVYVTFNDLRPTGRPPPSPEPSAAPSPPTSATGR